MRVTIFGVTCGVGHELIRTALEHQHQITIVSKDPSCIKSNNLDLRVVKGSIDDASSLKEALSDQEAVICALDDIDSMVAIVNAIDSQRVKRFIGVISPNKLPQKRFLPGILSRFFYPRSLQILEKLCTQKGIEWTIVEPPSLTFEPPTGSYRLYFHGCPFGDKKVSITDLAEFMIDELSSGSCCGRVVSVAN